MSHLRMTQPCSLLSLPICVQAFHSCGHSAQVDAIAFSQPSQQLRALLLCSCSAEVALIWDVQGCREASDKGEVGLGRSLIGV